MDSFSKRLRDHGVQRPAITEAHVRMLFSGRHHKSVESRASSAYEPCSSDREPPSVLGKSSQSSALESLREPFRTPQRVPWNQTLSIRPRFAPGSEPAPGSTMPSLSFRNQI